MLQVATSPCAVLSLSSRSSNRFHSVHTPLVKCWPGSQQISNTAVPLSDRCCSPVQAAASDLLAFAPIRTTATGGLHRKHERSKAAGSTPRISFADSPLSQQGMPCVLMIAFLQAGGPSPPEDWQELLFSPLPFSEGQGDKGVELWSLA